MIAILVEHLDAALLGILSHQDVVPRINKEMSGVLDLPSTQHTNKIALRIKDLQPFAFALTHHNIPIRQNPNTKGILQLAFSISLRPKLPDKCAIRVKI